MRRRSETHSRVILNRCTEEPRELSEIDCGREVGRQTASGRRRAHALAATETVTGRDTETRGHQKETVGDRDETQRRTARRRDACTQPRRSALAKADSEETEAEKLTASGRAEGVTERR